MTAAANSARSVRGTRESTISLAHRMTMFGRNRRRFFMRFLSCVAILHLLSRLRMRLFYRIKPFQRIEREVSYLMRQGRQDPNSSLPNLLARGLSPVLIKDQLCHYSLLVLDEGYLG